MTNLESLKEQIENLKVRLQELEQWRRSIEKGESEVSSGVTQLADKTGLSENEVLGLFELDFEEKKVHMLKSVEGKTKGERQYKATLCLLTAYFHVFGKNSLASSILKQELEELGIGSLVNLSTNMKKHRQEILPQGKPGSSDFAYKITVPGREDKGPQLIKELAS